MFAADLDAVTSSSPDRSYVVAVASPGELPIVSPVGT